MNQDQIKEIFFQEAEDLLNQYEEAILNLEQNIDFNENINALFRAIHTFKSSTALVGYPKLSDFCHHIENLLDVIRNGELPLNEKIINLLFQVEDVLKFVTDKNFNEDFTKLEPTFNELIKQANNFLGTNEQKEEKTNIKIDKKTDKGLKFYKINISLNNHIYETGTNPIMFFYELEEVGEIVQTITNIDNLPAFDQIDIYKHYISWEIILKSEEPISQIENIFIFVMDDNNKIKISDITNEYLKNIEKKEDITKTQDIPAKTQESVTVQVQPQTNINDNNQNKTKQIPIKEKPMSNKVIKKTGQKIKKASTIRVDTQKLDKLVNLVSEMVIAMARLNQISKDNHFIKNHDMANALEDLIRFSREIQEQVMKVRMIPVEGTFNRFYRIVRDMSKELNKKIRLEMYGTETELDKNVIEQLGDPLKHLIRNSVDHGIESPEERRKKGKPEEGLIQLKAYQQEGSIFIEIKDDGRGIDKEKVYQKAISKGLISPNQKFSDEDIYSFLFMPGFSTAEKVTEISGRGVGLDVVRKNIEDLKGSIIVESQKDIGTTFKIKLPLTLAIIDGMIVKVGKEYITIPLMSIIESIKPQQENIKSIEKEGELIEVRGEYLPLVRLHKLFNLETEKTDPAKALIIIIEGSRNKKFGLMVDDIIGEQQAVIKSLDKNFMQLPGTAGVTILGDGNLSLILDIYGLENLAFVNINRGNYAIQ